MKSREISALVSMAGGVAAGIGLAAGLAWLTGFLPLPSRAALAGGEQQLLAEVAARVRAEYVEPVDEGSLAEGAVRGMLATLDPHSQFLDAGEYEEIRISAAGNYVGVGLEVQARDGRVVVVAPIPGSAAARAGLRPGDVIVSVDGEPVDGAQVNETILRLRGEPGTTVVVTALRDGDGPQAVSLRRGPVHVQSVAAVPLAGGYGYVRLSRFNDTTASDLRRAIEDLQGRDGGLRGLVLDLRDNPGGVLDAAVAVADGFLETGVIVSASGRSRDATFRHDALPGDWLAGAPLAVLVNGQSASAAEIVAGALRDHGRATVVGARTFGKGSVQTVLPLSGGSAIKLTTSRYFMPSGESIHERGVTPDVVLPGASPHPEGPARDPQVAAAVAALSSGAPPAGRLLLTSREP
jgi:carboxyl-terminal processing protease